MEIISVYFSREKYTTIEARIKLKQMNVYPILRAIRNSTDYVYIVLNENIFTHHITRNIGEGIMVKFGFF